MRALAAHHQSVKNRASQIVLLTNAPWSTQYMTIISL
jgi:hypothetical protein